MKSLSITNLINRSPLRSGVFLIALSLIIVLTMGAPTANGAPGDLIAPQLSISQNPGGDIFQLPINPSFGTPSFYWDNANLPGHYWAGIAFDQSGNLYASDVSSGEIYKLPPDRSTLILFASGLNAPAGLAVDAAGNLYEADTGSGNIYKFTPQGVLSTFASGLNLIQGTGAYGNDNTIVFDSHGNLFVASNYNDTYPSTGSIYKISPQGAVITFADLPDGYLGGAIGFDSAGNLFILTGNGYVYNYRLLKYTPDGTEFTVFGGGDLYYDCGISGTGLVIDNADNIYIGTVPDYINEYLPRTRAGIRFRAYTSGVASLMRFLDNSSFSQR